MKRGVELELFNAYLKQILTVETVVHTYLFDMLMLKLDSEDQVRKLQ